MLLVEVLAMLSRQILDVFAAEVCMHRAERLDVAQVLLLAVRLAHVGSAKDHYRVDVVK